ncbi:MAG: hypothetical protein KGH49_02825 [Candidatus Micrarchaeota archaeon]|nr:hypothetical protein [Candidatus Micrarchaeota archaeon]
MNNMNVAIYVLAALLVLYALYLVFAIQQYSPVPTNITTTAFPGTPHIQIISVSPANLTVGSQLHFNVTFRNAGTVPIYYTSVCGSSLNFSVSPASSALFAPAIRCLCSTSPARVDPLGIAGVSAPNCGSGFSYTATKPGKITVNFVLTWWANSSYAAQNYTSFSQNFTVQ